jgi:hypothetical protein
MTASIIPLFPRKATVIAFAQSLPSWRPVKGERVTALLPAIEGDPVEPWPGTVMSGEVRGGYAVQLDNYGGRWIALRVEQMRPMTGCASRSRCAPSANHDPGSAA